MRVRARAGYTLVELMMIVAIIGISTMVFTPGFSRAMADRKVSLAARELIRVGRRARADTFGYLRSHLLWINPSARTVQLLRGPTNSCTLVNWSEVVGDCGTGLANNQHRCVENLWMSDLSGTRTISIFEETISGGSTTYSTTGRALCFQPSGVMMYGSGANLATASAPTTLQRDNISGNGGVNGGFIFSLLDGANAPTSSDTSKRVHRVLFPMGGSPRSMR
ncbi:MAG: type II secretion system protein [Polyangiales bacterium]